MDSGVYNFICNQGATFYYPINWADEILSPIDLTDFDIRMRVKESSTSTTSIIDLNLTNGRIVVGDPPTDGNFTLNITPEDTAALPEGRYRYDLEAESAGGNVTRLLQGRFRIRAEITT